MEAVPITNCSSTLPSLSKVVLPSKRLCRNLFGPVDHGQIASILDAELNHDVKEKSEEWCFDFSEGTPLKNGRLSWEEVDASNERSETRKSEKAPDGEARVPDLHDESCTFESNDDLKTCRLRRTSLTTTSKTVSSPVSSDSTVTEMKSPSIEVRKRKKPYRTITDFMKQKKRRRVSHSSLPEKNSKLESAEETRCAKDDTALRSPAKMARVST